ncbi:MAG: Uma2 family endonuclease [Pseudomonadota bacterium]
MNIHRPIQSPQEPTPHRITVDEYFALSRDSLNHLDRKFELWDGVIIEMPSDSPLTVRWTSTINRWLFSNLDESYVIASDATLRMDGDWAPDPDHFVFQANVREEDLRPTDVLLLIEVSNTTLKSDLGKKAIAYAENGIREYWVIDPNSKTLFAHQLREDGTYGPPAEIAFTDTITAQHIPGLTLRMADLPRIS